MEQRKGGKSIILSQEEFHAISAMLSALVEAQRTAAIAAIKLVSLLKKLQQEAKSGKKSNG